MNTKIQERQTTKPEKCSIKTIAIIQIARIGDLLQTYQSCLSMKNEKSLRLILITRKRFSSPITSILKSVFHEIIELDTKMLLTCNLSDSTKHLQSITEQINNRNIDVLINFSYSKASSYLTSLISSNYKLGPYYEKMSGLAIHDTWSRYVYASVLETGLNPFHLNDIFKSILGTSALEHKNYVQKQQDPPLRPKKGIVVHPFSSLKRKRWKNARWTEVIYKVLKDHPEQIITIVGSKDDKEDAQEILNSPIIQKYTNKIIDVTGQKSFPEVLELLEKSELFIGHDSVIGHLATIAKTQTLTISLGSVRPAETSPYQSNAYIIAPKTKCFPCKPTTSCANFTCHTDINYLIVSECINQLLEHRKITYTDIKKKYSEFHTSSAIIYKGYFDNNQFFRLKNLSNTPPDTAELYRDFYYVLWSFLFNESISQLDFSQLTPHTHKVLYQSLSSIEQLYELSKFGQKYSRDILNEIASETPKISTIKQLSSRIDEIDELTKLLKQTNFYLAPLINYFELKKSNLPGKNLVQITESSYLNFLECSNICQALYELIEKTIINSDKHQTLVSHPKLIKEVHNGPSIRK